MKIVLNTKKTKKLNEFEPVTTILLAGLAALLGGFVGMLFGPKAKEQAEKAAKKAEETEAAAERAIEADPGISPRGKKKIRGDLRNAFKEAEAKIKELQAKANNKEAIKSMTKKPTEIAAEYIEQYEEKLDKIVSGVRVKPETKDFIQKHQQALQDLVNTLKMADKIAIMYGKTIKGGLWDSVVKDNTELAGKLQDEQTWEKFVDLLMPHTKSPEPTAAPEPAAAD